jgi:hypothetical protein
MLNYYVDIAARKSRLRPLGAAASAALNLFGLAGDRVARLRYPNEDTLIHNFLAVARRQPEDHAPAPGLAGVSAAGASRP